jgi:hypothetical protein
MRIRHPKPFLLLTLLGGLVILLSPTWFLENNTASAATAQTLAMPATSTSCPPDGTARAAVMKPIKLGPHQNVVYVYNEIPLNTSTAFPHLRRYDVVTGQKTELPVTEGLSIEHAQVSADGQWVLFVTMLDPRVDRVHAAKLQLIRMDGRELQTLYCFPSANPSQISGFLPINVQWSTDQKSILLDVDTNNTTSTITLLDVATGKLRTELNITDNTMSYGYELLKWLDTTRAYVAKVGRTNPAPPATLYLLDTAKNRDIHGGDLKQVLTYAVRFHLVSLDNSLDAKQLFESDCLLAANPFDSTISVGPATGGTRHTIYHQAGTTCITSLRVVSPSRLFMLVRYTPDQDKTVFNQVWTLKPDGSGRVVLVSQNAKVGDGLEDWSLSPYTQYPWSNVSRDGTLYSFKAQAFMGNTTHQTLRIGSLNGGAPKVFAFTDRGSVAIVGWTTM